MSRIYFHTRDHGTAEVAGPERHYAASVCRRMLKAALELGGISELDTPEEPHWTREILPPGAYPLASSGERYLNHLELYLSGFGEQSAVLHEGKCVAIFDAQLNTALAAGSDPVKLLARIHGQCEIHLYIPLHSKVFVASVIQEGRKSGVLRANVGWEGVLDLMEEVMTSIHPLVPGSNEDRRNAIVLSYSVTDQFPGCEGEGDERSHEVRWDEHIGRLWADPLLALEESHFREGYEFGSGVNGFQIREAAIQRARARTGEARRLSP